MIKSAIYCIGIALLVSLAFSEDIQENAAVGRILDHSINLQGVAIGNAAEESTDKSVLIDQKKQSSNQQNKKESN